MEQLGQIQWKHSDPIFMRLVARKGRREPFLPSPRQHQRDVIGLLVGADPVVDGGGHDLADPRQRQIAILPYQVDQPLFAEFTKIVFRFGHAVAVRQEEFAAAQGDRSLFDSSGGRIDQSRCPRAPACAPIRLRPE